MLEFQFNFFRMNAVWTSTVFHLFNFRQLYVPEAKQMLFYLLDS